MAKKKTRYASRPSIVVRLFYLVGRLSVRLLGCLTRLVLRGARRNPLLASGFSLFIITSGFVSANAFFRQPVLNRDVFFPPQPVRDTAAALSHQGGFTAGGAAGPRDAPQQKTVVPVIDIDLEATQKKLAALGLYKGRIDGLSGPQTIEAIEKWEQLQKSLVNSGDMPVRAADSISLVIRSRADMAAGSPAAGGKREADAAPPRMEATIRRVQEALRLFGNSDIVVNGIQDRITEKAVRAFQDMFDLPVTGRIDPKLIDKMREIGIMQ